MPRKYTRKKKVAPVASTEKGYRIVDRRGQDVEPSTPKANGLYPNPTPGYTRPRIYSIADTHKSVDTGKRTDLLRYSRELFSTCSNLGGAIIAKNSWAFNGGWTPEFMGNNTEWGMEVSRWRFEKCLNYLRFS